jgi:hypothetical protein
MPPLCQISEATLLPGVRAVVIENDLLAATLLLDQGADIYALVYKPRNMDVLWKSVGGLKPGGRDVPAGEASTEPGSSRIRRLAVLFRTAAPQQLQGITPAFTAKRQ